MRTSRLTLMIAALAGAAASCGAQEDVGGGAAALADQEEAIGSTSDALRYCPNDTRQLVCGTNGRTFTSICRAGGVDRVAHVGACAGFRCNGVVCVAGFTCKTAVNFGVPSDSCVSDTGASPACSCASGLECTIGPSGATSCVAPAPVETPDPASLCAGFTCPAGTSCRVTTINFGVPAPTCMY
jgi:hypothetical protein